MGKFRFFKRLFFELPKQLRLAYCLIRDPRVPTYIKVAFGGGLGVLLSPVVNFPEMIPFVGELDAAAVTLIATKLFIKACPDDVIIDLEQQIIEQRSVFDDDVRRGEKIATLIASKFRSDSDHDVLGSAAREKSKAEGVVEWKVLFVKEVAGVATAREIKEVKPGFARNYLLPQGIGVLANDKTIEQVKMREAAIVRKTEKELADARSTAATIKKLTVTVFAKAGEAGRLHGSVTNADISQQLKREAGLHIDKKKIAIETPIKTLGPHEVSVEIHPEITETLKIVVAAQ